MEYTKTEVKQETEMQEFIRLFPKKYTDLYSENGKILRVKTDDPDAQTWLAQHRLTGR